MKGVSPFLASVLIIAFTLSVAAIIGGWLVSTSKTETEIVELERQRTVNCSQAILVIDSTTCVEGNSLLKVKISNLGTIDLYDFSTLAMINDVPYINSTGGPSSSDKLGSGESFILSYFCDNSTYCQDGLSITKVRVSPANCPAAHSERDYTDVGC